MNKPTVASLAADLAAGRTTSRALTERALARIKDPAGEGARVFIRVDEAAALAAADASDRLRKAGCVPSPLAGLPISIKDLFDIAGQVTTAGSKVLRDQPPATQDAPVVARLRAAGAIIVGRTNMTEFAYSGLGINPHYGTPGNAVDRARVPGGSSSGAGVSVGDGMAVVALGTDTGGSVRIPAAFNGVTGFKPTARRIPLDGGVPLSTSLDSYGPLANSLTCCAIFDAILAAEPVAPPAPKPVDHLTLGLIANYVLDGMDETVARAYRRAVDHLAARGARIKEVSIPALADLPKLTFGGGFSAAESYAWHRRLLETRRSDYDPRVVSRIMKGADMSAADYIDLLETRAAIRAAVDAATQPFDAVIMPTVAVVPPRIEDCRDEENYTRNNLATLRNTSVGNFLDRCSLTLPIHAPGELPVGLMLMGETMGDRHLLSVGLGVEAALATP